MKRSKIIILNPRRPVTTRLPRYIRGNYFCRTTLFSCTDKDTIVILRSCSTAALCRQLQQSQSARFASRGVRGAVQLTRRLIGPVWRAQSLCARRVSSRQHDIINVVAARRSQPYLAPKGNRRVGLTCAVNTPNSTLLAPYNLGLTRTKFHNGTYTRRKRLITEKFGPSVCQTIKNQPLLKLRAVDAGGGAPLLIFLYFERTPSNYFL